MLTFQSRFVIIRGNENTEGRTTLNVRTVMANCRTRATPGPAKGVAPLEAGEAGDAAAVVDTERGPRPGPGGTSKDKGVGSDLTEVPEAAPVAGDARTPELLGWNGLAKAKGIGRIK